MSTAETPARIDFIRETIEHDLASAKHSTIVTRFPPEPNGFPHIGHAKAICINFGIAQEYNGRCHLRFDDTNPAKEEQRYIDAIKEDIRWLGFDWGEHEYYASDYFDQLYAWAEHLIRNGLAYVDEQSVDEIRASRGTLTEPGRPSPFRNRPVTESLDLFSRMKAGEFKDGAMVVRAKIDMTSPNMNMRDPVLYRILNASHPRTGTTWHIYPMYDFAHGQSDAIEAITHSLCSLEFEDHRPLYEWFLEHLPVPHAPRQIEFARLNIGYTVTAKRVLRELVEHKHVSGWDDPRMPTLRGIRRRGYPPEAVRAFCDRVGVTKFNSMSDMALLEHAVRDELNRTALRFMAVLDPVKVIIENYPQGTSEELEAVNNPEDAAAGTRMVPFSRELYIERADFMEDPPGKFYRLAPGREVRLRWAYFITCTGVEKDAQGNITAIRATYDPATKGGDAPDGRKVKGTLHWVSAQHALGAEVRLYDRLFNVENVSKAMEDGSLADALNPDSLEVIEAMVEPALQHATQGDRIQFERIGYFCIDPDSTPERLVFNRTVGLRDSWAKSGMGGG
ncbi:MAG: glutamine--tRNA ligase/YqeY domain fusion protein [Phycisphaerales bacterium]